MASSPMVIFEILVHVGVGLKEHHDKFSSEEGV